MWAAECGVGSGVREDDGGVGARGDGGVAGDFEGTHQLADGLFTASASGEAFEGGNCHCGQKSHDADDGEEFDECKSRLITQRSQRVAEV